MGLLDLEDPLYEAFTRSDQYGKLGKKQQPLSEKIRLVVMAFTLVPLRLLGCFYFVLAFYLTCRLSEFIPKADRPFWVENVGCFAARACCWVVGFFNINWVEVRPNGAQDHLFTGVHSKDHPNVGAVISNHCSYFDILILMSRYFPSFVARSNTQDMPLIGVCSKHLQCIFVDREFKKGAGEIKGAGAQVKDRMERVASGEGLRPVLLFPEGTTTNGKQLLPFKTGAFLAGAPVQPCMIKYTTNKVSPSWDSIDAIWHVFLMLAEPTHKVTVYLLPVYKPSPDERKDPHLYASNVRQMLMNAGGFGSSAANLMDCRAYISMLQGRKPSIRSQAGKAWEEKYGPGEAKGLSKSQSGKQKAR